MWSVSLLRDFVPIGCPQTQCYVAVTFSIHPLTYNITELYFQEIILDHHEYVLIWEYEDLQLPRGEKKRGILGTRTLLILQFSSVAVVSDSLWPHGLQHARLPCPSSTPRTCSNSCPLSQWCHPTISSFVVPFSSCLQSFLASGSFQMSQLFASGGQSIGVSASTSVLSMTNA